MADLRSLREGKNPYIVDGKQILSRDSFGIVHPAYMKGRQVAAKCIDKAASKQFQKISRFYDSVLQLDHENLVKVVYMFFEDNNLWVYKEFCERGDLNCYFDKNSVPQGEKLNIMRDVAQGVEYLHSKNIIHRDIKPANILLTGSPVLAKLTDFDVSKFLEEDWDVFATRNDVGTTAFKAPEFWMRNAKGKLNYHSNVDVYSMGLTFLAMIQKNKALIPRIETPNDPSEVHQNIGVIIAERVRFKVKPLEIVVVGENPPAGSTPEYILEQKIRRLIAAMTRFKPKERLSATDVVSHLADLRVCCLRCFSVFIRR